MKECFAYCEKKDGGAVILHIQYHGGKQSFTLKDAEEDTMKAHPEFSSVKCTTIPKNLKDGIRKWVESGRPSTVKT